MAIERRNFPGVSQTTLETWLGWVNEELATGTTRQSWSAGDTNASHWIDTSLKARTRQQMILNDLGILDPTDYPPEDYQPIKLTRVRYCD